MKEPKFSIRAIPDEISAAARNTRKSPQYGHPAHVEVAGGTGPCRQCLCTFDVGKENRILFTTIRSMGSIHIRLRAPSSSTKPHAPHIPRKINSPTLFARFRSCSKVTGAIVG
jgi:hypothetical protein